MRTFFKSILLLTFFFTSKHTFAQLQLTEISSRNATIYKEGDKDYVDFIEVKNTSSTATINTNNYFLTDDKTQPTKWPFFSQTLGPNQTTIVFADKENSYLWFNTQQHCNFAINITGDTIYLANAAGVLIDSLIWQQLEPNQSVGRQPNVSNGQVFFETNTPNNTNPTTFYSAVAASPTISIPGGLYNATQTITATCPSGQTAIYTIGGNTPKATSPNFPASLQIASNAVVKVRCKAAGMLLGNIKTETYFINETTTLPIISISTDSANLYNYNTGIFMAGPDSMIFGGANYLKMWRRAAKFEYFENGTKQFGKDVSINTDGGSSIVYPKRTLRIGFNHTTLGVGKLNHTLFPNEKPNVTSFKNLKLRNGGNVYGITYTNGGGGFLFHDGIIGTFLKGQHMAYAAYKPVLLFINGGYFGLYEMRERMDENFYKTNYGANEDSVVLFNKDWPYSEYYRWDSVINYVDTTNALAPTFVNNFGKFFDEKNIADYFATELHFKNTDWLGSYQNNIKIWIDKAATADGKYRYGLYDMDYSCSNYYFSNPLLDIMYTTPSSHKPVKMFRAYLRNADFKNRFVNRYCDLMNWYFHTDTVLAKYDAYNNQISAADIARECSRWPTNDPSAWNQKLANVKAFVSARNTEARNQLDSCLGGNQGLATLTFTTQPANAGTIQVSTLNPTILPWSGIYCKGNPLPVKVTANAGYIFKHWLNGNTVLTITDSFFQNFTQNTTLTAVFIPKFADAISTTQKENGNLQVYPTLATEVINIKVVANNFANQMVAIKIIDAQSKIVMQTKSKFLQVNTSATIPVQNLQTGNYFITITAQNGTVETFTFIKK